MKKAVELRIRINHECQAVAVDVGSLKELARFALAAEKIRKADLSVALVDNATIHRLNRQYLAHDYPTDVLTFPFAHTPALQGEIVIGVEYAACQAPEFQQSVQEEVGLYLVHGILHLCDYRDDDDEQAEIMKARQSELLAQFARRLRPPGPSTAAGVKRSTRKNVNRRSSKC